MSKAKIDPALHAQAAAVIQRGLLDPEIKSVELDIHLGGNSDDLAFNQAYLDVCQRLTKVVARIVEKGSEA